MYEIRLMSGLTAARKANSFGGTNSMYIELLCTILSYRYNVKVFAISAGQHIPAG